MGRSALYRATLDKSKEIAPLCAGVVYSATYGGLMDEEKGFIIRDRRGVGSESVEKTNDTAAQAQTAKSAEPAQKQPVPPINFLSFVYSLGTSALMCLGEPVGEGAAGGAFRARRPSACPGRPVASPRPSNPLSSCPTRPA